MTAAIYKNICCISQSSDFLLKCQVQGQNPYLVQLELKGGDDVFSLNELCRHRPHDPAEHEQLRGPLR